jgi:hypothetical protein
MGTPSGQMAHSRPILANPPHPKALAPCATPPWSAGSSLLGPAGEGAITV